MQLAGGAWWSTESIQPCMGLIQHVPGVWWGCSTLKKKGRMGGKKPLYRGGNMHFPALSAGCKKPLQFLWGFLFLFIRPFAFTKINPAFAECAHGTELCTLRGWRVAKDVLFHRNKGTLCLGQGDCWTTFAPALGHNWRGEEHGRESWVDGFFSYPVCWGTSLVR